MRVAEIALILLLMSAAIGVVVTLVRAFRSAPETSLVITSQRDDADHLLMEIAIRDEYMTVLPEGLHDRVQQYIDNYHRR